MADATATSRDAATDRAARGHPRGMRPLLRPYTSGANTGFAPDPETSAPIDSAPDTLREEPEPDTVREGFVPRKAPGTSG